MDTCSHLILQRGKWMVVRSDDNFIPRFIDGEQRDVQIWTAVVCDATDSEYCEAYWDYSREGALSNAMFFESDETFSFPSDDEDGE